MSRVPQGVLDSKVRSKPEPAKSVKSTYPRTMMSTTTNRSKRSLKQLRPKRSSKKRKLRRNKLSENPLQLMLLSKPNSSAFIDKIFEQVQGRSKEGGEIRLPGMRTTSDYLKASINSIKLKGFEGKPILAPRRDISSYRVWDPELVDENFSKLCILLN